MDKAAKTRTRRFVLAVILSVMLVAGIPMIIVGAIGPDEGHGAMHAARIGYKVMMGIGIVFTVFGFYGTPMGWVMFGTANSELTIVAAVRNEHLYTVNELAARLGKNDKETAHAAGQLRAERVSHGIQTGRRLPRAQREYRSRAYGSALRLSPLRRSRHLHSGRKNRLSLLRLSAHSSDKLRGTGSRDSDKAKTARRAVFI